MAKAPNTGLQKDRWRRNGRVLVALAATVPMALLAGCNQEKAKQAGLLPVRAQEVKLMKYRPEFALTGEVSARVQSDLSFRISGQVTERNVDVGAHVAAGDVLARLDAKVQEADVAGSAAAVEAAAAKVRQVSAVFERQKTLLAQGFTTRRDYDQAEQVERSAEAALDSAKAQLATARDQLTQTVLRAPAAGVVTTRHMEVGQVVQPSMPVFTLAEDGPRDAVVNVQEALLTAGPLDGVEIALISDPRVKTGGEIREIAPAVNAAGAVRVKVGIAAAPPAMTLGSAVRVALHAEERERVVVPWSALYSDAGQPAVWVVDPASWTVSLRPIQVDAYRNSDVVVRDGLRVGEVVVTAGAPLLRPTQQVAITEDRP